MSASPTTACAFEDADACSICLSVSNEHSGGSAPRRYCRCETGMMHPDCFQKWLDTAAQAQHMPVGRRLTPDLPFADVIMSADSDDGPVTAHLSVDRSHTFDQAQFALARRLGWLSARAREGLTISTLPRSVYEFSNSSSRASPWLRCWTCLESFRVEPFQEARVSVGGRGGVLRRLALAAWRCFGHLAVALLALAGLELFSRLALQQSGLFVIEREWHLCIALLECMAFGEATVKVVGRFSFDCHFYDWRDVQAPLQRSVCKQEWQQRIVDSILPYDDTLFPELRLMKEFRRTHAVRAIQVQHCSAGVRHERANESSKQTTVDQLRNLLAAMVTPVCKILVCMPALAVLRFEQADNQMLSRLFLLLWSILALQRMLQYSVYLWLYQRDIAPRMESIGVPRALIDSYKIVECTNKPEH